MVYHSPAVTMRSLRHAIQVYLAVFGGIMIRGTVLI
jgi:hypothetical protein